MIPKRDRKSVMNMKKNMSKLISIKYKVKAIVSPGARSRSLKVHFESDKTKLEYIFIRNKKR